MISVPPIGICKCGRALAPPAPPSEPPLTKRFCLILPLYVARSYIEIRIATATESYNVVLTITNGSIAWYSIAIAI